MIELESRFATTNGIRMHYLEAGSGPLVLFCHGFPEMSWSWRHQMRALAAAGFRAVAPDLRGFGRTDAPADSGAYTLLHTTGDMVGLLDALGEEQAVVVGHDWGAVLAWQCALFRPDRFRAVAGLSVPYSPRGGLSLIALLRAMKLDRFYMMYFQEPGVAEADLERDPVAVLRGLYFGASGEGAKAGKAWPALVPEDGFSAALAGIDRLPSWLPDADFQVFADSYRATGFRGGLNWYRNLHRSWELTGAWTGTPIRVPALFIAGTDDGVLAMPALAQAVTALPQTLTDLRGHHMIPGAGHWVQQEAPETVTGHLLDFLRGL